MRSQKYVSIAFLLYSNFQFSVTFFLNDFTLVCPAILRQIMFIISFNNINPPTTTLKSFLFSITWSFCMCVCLCPCNFVCMRACRPHFSSSGCCSAPWRGQTRQQTSLHHTALVNTPDLVDHITTLARKNSAKI